MLRRILQYTCDLRPRREFFLGGGGCSERCVTELINSNFPWEGEDCLNGILYTSHFTIGTKVFKIFQFVFILEKKIHMKIDIN